MKEKRFAFGRNWKRYLATLNEQDIGNAVVSLGDWIGRENQGKRFLDIGSGSGLSSLAASRLGFSSIHSLDYDQDSVEATRALKSTYHGSDNASQVWAVEQGSVLDTRYMGELQKADLVYSWGVLHHTGDMWKAVEIAADSVAEGGKLYLAIYNDQGWISSYWSLVKKSYVASPSIIKLLMLLVFWTYFGVGLFIADCLRLRNPFARHRRDHRGMKFFYDVIDWVGGYPFEVASAEAMKQHLGDKGFSLIREKTVGTKHGCNEFLWEKR